MGNTSISFRSKFSTVQSQLKNKKGTVIDIGARSRFTSIIESSNDELKYFSADRAGPHDFHIDLESALPFRDEQFDYVVALDVLEHIDKIHDAFDELLRIAKRSVIISLPNLATLSRRVSFLLRGDLRTKKYDLNREPTIDRHRWVTTYSAMRAFVEKRASHKEALVENVIDEVEGKAFLRLCFWILGSMRLIPRSLIIERSIFVIKK